MLGLTDESIYPSQKVGSTGQSDQPRWMVQSNLSDQSAMLQSQLLQTVQNPHFVLLPSAGMWQCTRRRPVRHWCSSADRKEGRRRRRSLIVSTKCFLLFPLIFSAEMKNEMVPTRATFSRSFQLKMFFIGWASFFHFGTENRAEQLKKPPYIS